MVAYLLLSLVWEVVTLLSQFKTLLFNMLRDVGSMVVSEPAVSDPPLGVGGLDAALIVQDRAVHHDPARDEMPRFVGSTILSEPDFNSDTMVQNQFLIQKHSMILTEQV